MKAVHLLNSLKYGGGENVAYNYAEILTKMSVESTFVGRHSSEDYEKKIATIGVVEYRCSCKILKEAQFIFVHSNVNLLRLLWYKMFPLGWNKKKVIYIQHLNYSHVKFLLLSVLINLICTDFIQITPITTKYVSRYIKINVDFIVNFYRNKYSESEWPALRNEVREQLGIEAQQTVITFSSVLKPGKNIGEFLDLASQMQQFKNITFLVIGDGIESDLVKKYQGKNLIWVGFVNDVEKYLVASDIYVFLSKVEMMPMALIEAVNTNKYIACYKTEVNDFILNGHTFVKIDASVMCKNILPCGSGLRHYDTEYAFDQISKLLCLNLKA